MNFTYKIAIITVLTLVSMGIISIYQGPSRPVGTATSKEPVVPQFTVLLKPAQDQADALLHKEEQAVWTAFNKFGVTTDLLEQYKQKNPVNDAECVATYGDKKQLSEQTISLIKKIAQNFDLNLDLMTICSYKNGPAAATDTAIMVNEDELSTYQTDVQMFIIAHELQHMIHQDYYTKCLIKQIIKDKQIDWQKVEPIYNNYVHFTELRADLKAATKNFNYAVAYISSAQQLIREQGNHGDPMHPYPVKRLQLATNIVEQMTQNNTQGMA